MEKVTLSKFIDTNNKEFERFKKHFEIKEKTFCNKRKEQTKIDDAVAQKGCSSLRKR